LGRLDCLRHCEARPRRDLNIGQCLLQCLQFPRQALARYNPDGKGSEMSDTFERAKAEKFSKIQDALANLTDTLGIPCDMAPRREAARKLWDACASLSQIIAAGDRPEWLQALEASSRSLSENPENEYAKRLQRAVVKYSSDVQPISANAALAFDSYFQGLYEQENIEEKFARLAEEMQKLVDSGEVGDVGAIAILERMIAALKANKKASFFATWFTIDVLKKGWPIVLGVVTFSNQLSGTIKNISEMVEKAEDSQEAIVEEMKKKADGVLASSSPRAKRLIEHCVPAIEGPK
jgi:hypothetical protein